VLDVRDGELQTISRNGMPADCRYTVDAPTLLSIVAGKLSPQQAFFQRRVDIAGDVAVGLKTAAILSQFFRTFPFQPTAA
jgi:predicted lipid carrier protein YhbT